ILNSIQRSSSCHLIPKVLHLNYRHPNQTPLTNHPETSQAKKATSPTHFLRPRSASCIRPSTSCFPPPIWAASHLPSSFLPLETRNSLTVACACGMLKSVRRLNEANT